MNTILDKRIIALSSSSGTLLNGSFKSNINFSFPNLYQADPSVAYAEVGVVNAEIPVSFYTINDTNNSIVCTLSTGIATTVKTVVLSNGNYIATSFFDELKSKLQLAYAVENPTNIVLLATAFNRFNGKVSLSLPANAEFTELQFDNSNLRRLIGFSPSTSVQLLEGALATVADFPINLLGINKIYLSTNNLQTYNYDSGKQGYSNILATIEVDAPPYGIILFKNQTMTYNILRNPDVNSFTTELKDDVGNFLDFNNIDWNITLALNIYRYIVPASISKFSDVLGLGIKAPPPPTEDKKADEKAQSKDPQPIIRNDLDLLTYG
jgi:hypothetical protein